MPREDVCMASFVESTRKLTSQGLVEMQRAFVPLAKLCASVRVHGTVLKCSCTCRHQVVIAGRWSVAERRGSKRVFHVGASESPTL